MNRTGIEYADYTWNLVLGCRPVCEGCKNCWAARMAKRLKGMGRPEYQKLVDARGRWTGSTALMQGRLDKH